jgi:hypothetical protein
MLHSFFDNLGSATSAVMMVHKGQSTQTEGSRKNLPTPSLSVLKKEARNRYIQMASQ